MISFSCKQKLGYDENSRFVQIKGERWSNQHGWGMVLIMRFLWLFEVKFNVTRAYGE